MHKLAIVLTILFLAAGCRGADEERPGDVEPGDVPDTNGYEPTDMSATVDTIGPAGGTVRLHNRKACVDIPAGALTGDAVVSIQQTSPDSALPPPSEWPPALGDRHLHPPLYDISIRVGDEPVLLERDASFVICSHIPAGHENETQALRVLHLSQDGRVEILEPVQIPPACLPLNDSCVLPSYEEGRAQEAGSITDWIAGSPFSATPAHAAASQPSSQFLQTSGLGGKGRGGSTYVGTLP